MKVAIFATSLSGTGVGRVVLSLAEGLSQKGIDIDLVLMSGVSVYKINMSSSLRIVDLQSPRQWTSLPFFIRYLLKIRPRVVLAHGDLPILFSVIGKVFVHKTIDVYAIKHGTAGFVFAEKKALRHRLLKYAVRHSFRYADIVIAVSRGVAEQLVSSSLIQLDRIRIIYNGIDIDSIGSLYKKEVCSFFPNQHAPLILGVGTLSPQKNFTLLIQAFALVIKQQTCRLLILGEGSERPRLERFCREFDVCNVVAMPGFVANPFAYMAEASVFVLSSIHEGLPTVLIEAMACGTPVVSTDCPAGPREILSDGRYGSLVPMNDVEALAAAILNTLEHPLPADVLKARAQDFSLEAYIEAYQKLLAPYMAEGEKI